MQLFAVTGKPILHSKSPLMFNAVFDTEKTDARYFRLAADTATEAIEQFKQNKLKGMNVTAPFKEDIMPLLDKIDEAAKTIGSVNTVVEENGQLVGYNTDYKGVARSLEQNNVDITAKRCIVLGAGGAARGVVYALAEKQAKVTIINRTFAKAEKLAKEFNCEAKPLNKLREELSSAELFISTLGSDISLVDPEWLKKETVIFDANYKSSTLLKHATNKGCKTISGLDWLLNQAVPAFELFLGRTPDIQVMRTALEKGSIDKKNYSISFVGFMGVGKTTNGSLFADKYNMRFVDSDIAITKRYKKTIAEIFEEEGETGFRQKESETLDHILRYPNTVISCGGGLVLKPENREQLMRRTMVVWLSASPEMVIERMKPNSRPLLAVENPLEKAKVLLSDRMGVYASAADIMVNSEGKTSEQIVEKIYEEINLAFNS